MTMITMNDDDEMNWNGVEGRKARTSNRVENTEVEKRKERRKVFK